MTENSKIKNRNYSLSLSQRVEVIREYDQQVPKPKLVMLAHKYNVTYPQIKKILENRDSILNEYFESGSHHVNEKLLQKFIRQRQEKITFLGKVMYEYIQRSMHQYISLCDEKILQKAKEIKECIALVNFEPKTSWLQDFKKTYGIPSFDLATLRNNITIMETKHTSLATIDLITYLTGTEKKRQSAKRKMIDKGQIMCISPRSSSPPPLYYHKEPKIVCQRTSATTFLEALPTVNNIDSGCLDIKQEPEFTDNHCINCSNRDIQSADEALKYLRRLEEYAMLQDNFRAIGLLTQLEEVLSKPLNSE